LQNFMSFGGIAFPWLHRPAFQNSGAFPIEKCESPQQQQMATLVWKFLLSVFHLWWECDILNTITGSSHSMWSAIS
jgi:hypothetical protein